MTWLDALLQTKSALFTVLDKSDPRVQAFAAGELRIVDRDPQASARARSKHRLIALGPSFRIDSSHGPEVYQSAVCTENEAPTSVKLMLTWDAPSYTWFDAGQTLASIEAAWNELIVQTKQGQATKTARLFGGLLANPPGLFYQLENWCATSPYTNHFPLQLGTALGVGKNGKSSNESDPMHTSVFQSAFSQSVMTFTGLHQLLPDATVLLLDIEYVPAPHRAVIDAYNKAFDAAWPLDIPLDVLGTFGHTLGMGQGQLREQLDDLSKSDLGNLAALIDVLLTAPEAQLKRIEELTKHPDAQVRFALIGSTFYTPLPIAEATLRFLTTDGDAEVQAAALEELAVLNEELAEKPKKATAKKATAKKATAKKATAKKATAKKATAKKATAKKATAKKATAKKATAKKATAKKATAKKATAKKATAKKR